MKRNATAVWNGTGKEGKGHLTTQSTVLDKTQYSFSSRFENGIGTNPEELVAAAHAGCFTMKLTFILNAAGFTPDEIETRCGTSIKECCASKGETYFRQVEQETAEALQNTEHCILSCGGGVIKNEDTMRALSQNGIVIWIQRDLHALFATDSRPLTGDETYMKKLYEERKDLYQKYSDAVVVNDGSLEEAVEKIKKVAGE